MSRPLRSAFIATVSTAALSGCSSDPPPIVVGHPPEPTPTVEASPTAAPTATETEVAVPPPTTAPRQPGPLNPRDAEGRIIHVDYDGEGCFVYLPFPPLENGQKRPPGTAPPSQPTACPPEMADPAYQSCKGGQVKLKPDGETCQCFISGNPPRITDHPCPQ